MGFKSRRPRNSYSKEILNKAIAAVNSGLTVNEASRKFRIPRSSLYIKVSSKYDILKAGNTPLLALQAEDKLTQWLEYMLTLGRPVSKEHIINSAALLARETKKNPFNGGRPGDYWCECFYRRNEGLKRRMREVTWRSQFEPTIASLINWFRKIEKQFDKKDVFEVDSFRVFNIGEISLELNPSSDNRNSDQSGTMLIAGNAAGQL